jgi:dipeptidyl-peptidase-4
MGRLVCFAALVLSPAAFGQHRLLAAPEWEEYQKFSRDWASTARTGAVETRWVSGTKLAYRSANAWRVLHVISGNEEQVAEPPPAWQEPRRARHPNDGRRRPGRGLQFSEAFSQDGKTKAHYQDGNVWLTVEGREPKPITKDGDPVKRVRFGTASWVYGEELGQTEALGVSDGGRWVWMYRFDESQVRDNMVVSRQTTPWPEFEPQAFPRPGSPNPKVAVFVYDVEGGKLVEIPVRGPDTEYVYDLQWAPGGLYFRRADRRQKSMELCRYDPEKRTTRVVVREEWPATYTENKLGLWFLERLPGGEKWKGKALYEHHRNGFLNLALLDLATGALSPVTENRHDLARVLRIDLDRGKVHYLGRGGLNPSMLQLWTATLDGKSNLLRTKADRHHEIRLSPDGESFVMVRQALDSPPVTAVVGPGGKAVKTLGEGDVSQAVAAGFSVPERLEYLAADGKTRLFGRISKPRGFDPGRKYPVLLSVYGGPLDPHGTDHSEVFSRPDAMTAFGFVCADLSNRGTGGRGKEFSDPLYRNMGVAEIDDLAAGIRALASRPWVDSDKVAVHGTSYGGYASLMLLLRHPEVFAAACSSSCVSDWRNYDTVYVERYMGLLEENKEAYDRGSALTYAKDLRGWLMLYYGTADENTHPLNTLMVVDRLQKAGRTFELQVGPDAGHSGIDWRRMMEFFMERLGVGSFSRG